MGPFEEVVRARADWMKKTIATPRILRISEEFDRAMVREMNDRAKRGVLTTLSNPAWWRDDDAPPEVHKTLAGGRLLGMAVEVDPLQEESIKMTLETS